MQDNAINRYDDAAETAGLSGNRWLRPVYVGNVRVARPLALGPMAGVTDLPFRLLCREQGAGLLYTEMISAKALLFHNRNTEALMQTDPSESPVALQLFGSEPDTVAEAAVMIADRDFDILDINMGCPVPKVVNNHEGSALMRDPVRAAAIVSAVTRRITKPVSVKIRKGFTEQEVNAPEFARRMEDAGAAMIAVHGRTRDQYYAGHADWEVIRRVKEAVSIPVLANGDADSPARVRALLERTGADGVMIARAARGNPWIFSETVSWLERGELPPRPSADALCGMILRHLQGLAACKGEYTAVREMRRHFAWYTAGLPHSSAFRRRINETTDMQGILAVTEELRQAMKREN